MTAQTAKRLAPDVMALTSEAPQAGDVIDVDSLHLFMRNLLLLIHQPIQLERERCAGEAMS